MLPRKDLVQWMRLVFEHRWVGQSGLAVLIAGSMAGMPSIVPDATVLAEEGKPAARAFDGVRDPFGEDGNVESEPPTYAERQKQLREKAEAERAARRSKGKGSRPSAARSGSGATAMAGVGGAMPRCGAGAVAGGGLSAGAAPSSFAMAMASIGSTGPAFMGAGGSGNTNGGGGATAIAIATASGGEAAGHCQKGGGNTAVAIASSGGGSKSSSGESDSSTTTTTSDGSSDSSSVDASLLPPLNAKILAFAQASIGQQIGNGECWTLGAEALAVAGAQPPEVYDFGDEIPLDKALPGDILQFYSAKFVDGNSYLIMGAPNHTGVLSNISGSRWTMLNQNVNGDRRVQPTTFNIEQLTEGTITVYRAVAR
jgi:hypothetical protein